MASLELVSLGDISTITASQVPQLYLTLYHFFLKDKQTESLKYCEYSPMWKCGAKLVPRSDLQKGPRLYEALCLEALWPRFYLL